jgi:hypothetical protein
VKERTHAVEYFYKLMGDLAALEALRGHNAHGPHNSFHEAHSVLREEFDELWVEVKRREPDMGKIEREATHVAAMAIRIAAMARRQRK